MSEILDKGYQAVKQTPVVGSVVGGAENLLLPAPRRPSYVDPNTGQTVNVGPEPQWTDRLFPLLGAFGAAASGGNPMAGYFQGRQMQDQGMTPYRTLAAKQQQEALGLQKARAWVAAAPEGPERQKREQVVGMHYAGFKPDATTEKYLLGMSLSNAKQTDKWREAKGIVASRGGNPDDDTAVEKAMVEREDELQKSKFAQQEHIKQMGITAADTRAKERNAILENEAKGTDAAKIARGKLEATGAKPSDPDWNIKYGAQLEQTIKDLAQMHTDVTQGAKPTPEDEAKKAGLKSEATLAKKTLDVAHPKVAYHYPDGTAVHTSNLTVEQARQSEVPIIGLNEAEETVYNGLATQIEAAKKIEELAPEVERRLAALKIPFTDWQKVRKSVIDNDDVLSQYRSAIGTIDIAHLRGILGKSNRINLNELLKTAGSVTTTGIKPSDAAKQARAFWTQAESQRSGMLKPQPGDFWKGFSTEQQSAPRQYDVVTPPATGNDIFDAAHSGE